MKEVWKKIKDFEKYELSNTGKVRSLNYNNTNLPKELKPKINKQGNLEITLNKNNKHYYRMINRLMFETFYNIELTKNDIIMYEDKNNANCSLDNLYIISRGKRQEITYDLDNRYRPKYEYYGEMISTKELAKRTGTLPKQVRTRIKQLKWSSYECEIPIARYKKKER